MFLNEDVCKIIDVACIQHLTLPPHYSLSQPDETGVFTEQNPAQSCFNDVFTNLDPRWCCWCVHIAADRCLSWVLTVRGAATAKCTQLASVTFNYASSTFHETVIEPGALPLFKTTGAAQFTLCPLKAPSLLLSTSTGLPLGPGGGSGSWGE